MGGGSVSAGLSNQVLLMILSERSQISLACCDTVVWVTETKCSIKNLLHKS